MLPCFPQTSASVWDLIIYEILSPLHVYLVRLFACVWYLDLLNVSQMSKTVHPVPFTSSLYIYTSYEVSLVPSLTWCTQVMQPKSWLDVWCHILVCVLVMQYLGIPNSDGVRTCVVYCSMCCIKIKWKCSLNGKEGCLKVLWLFSLFFSPNMQFNVLWLMCVFFITLWYCLWYCKVVISYEQAVFYFVVCCFSMHCLILFQN